MSVTDGVVGSLDFGFGEEVKSPVECGVGFVELALTYQEFNLLHDLSQRRWVAALFLPTLEPCLDLFSLGLQSIELCLHALELGELLRGQGILDGDQEAKLDTAQFLVGGGDLVGLG